MARAFCDLSYRVGCDQTPAVEAIAQVPLAKDGKVVTVGAHAGEVMPVDLILLFRSQWSLIGSVRASEDEIRHVVGLIAEGKLCPVVHAVLPLEEASEAHRILEERRQCGKLILAP